MKLCTSAHRQPVNIRWQDSAGSSGYWSDARKRAFVEQISACGIEPTENPGAPLLRVTAGLTPSRVLLVAELTDAANARQIRMVEVLRDAPLGLREISAGPHLTGELLWQQQRPISSATEWRDSAASDHFLFLLSDGRLIRMRLDSGSWHAVDSAELPAASRRVRSGEGVFTGQAAGNSLAFIRDGKLCSFQPAGDIAFSCSAWDSPEKMLLLSSPCEPSPRYLSSGKGDYSQPDQILLGSTASDQAVRAPLDNDAGSSSVDLPGPVLGISLAEKNLAAFAVVRNLSTGNYEVYRLTAVCGN